MCILFAHNSQIYLFIIFFWTFLPKTLIVSGCLVNATPLAVFANRFETSQIIRSWSEDLQNVCT